MPLGGVRPPSTVRYQFDLSRAELAAVIGDDAVARLWRLPGECLPAVAPAVARDAAIFVRRYSPRGRPLNLLHTDIGSRCVEVGSSKYGRAAGDGEMGRSQYGRAVGRLVRRVAFLLLFFSSSLLHLLWREVRGTTWLAETASHPPAISTPPAHRQHTTSTPPAHHQQMPAHQHQQMPAHQHQQTDAQQASRARPSSSSSVVGVCRSSSQVRAARVSPPVPPLPPTSRALRALPLRARVSRSCPALGPRAPRRVAPRCAPSPRPAARHRAASARRSTVTS